MNPVYALVWVPGAVMLLAGTGAGFRVAGTVAFLCLAVFIFAGVKFYFAVPVIMVFGAAGAVWWERLLKPRARSAGFVLATLLLLNGLVSVPIAAPVLPRETLQRVANFLRDSEAGREVGSPALLERYFPHFAEMHGWPELAISWRHQLPALAALGFRAIAPDMRGYGRSSVPKAHEDYALELIVADMLEKRSACERRNSSRSCC